MNKYYTYVRVFGASRPPHLLPKYVPDKLLAIEIAYHSGKGGHCLLIKEEQKILAHLSPPHRPIFSVE
jgi:hypothetical protein